ncbi:12750_t:CDS:2 [Rhizophagus irregularis]|nr:12750_t:CDS:2 [Rhizophagus irregularis]
MRTGIMISHLGSTSNDELKAFITEVFSMRAAEHIIKWLHLTSNGCIPDVLLQEMIYYQEDDEIDGIESLDPD